MVTTIQPGTMFKTPRKYNKKKDGTPTGEVGFIHEVNVMGDPVTVFADTDLTAALNGARDQLDTGAPVAVGVEVEQFAFDGNLRLKVVGVVPAKAGTAKA